ncbi:MAG TPA: pyridoxine/pyridoxal/pyridoxamine kinase [Dokdonella sp.]|uniref:pyridoxine/pyridoxal/pyridoxamine kinase n=1 Tax=Dokdonella sp. TaxID=2291710 RepID=UPI002D7E397A|nr:pyridoxine/pyridoxal/pyridoxamine kinase [Dokdonella sp.]HET9031432.1 pyridoxine/pyridoxal/pyridoxamine kinase [Dokdonella sp.]
MNIPSAKDHGTTVSLPIDVVSIQSQVVYGHVGNSVAVPTLQGFGLRVAAVPSVILSNTPHYPSMHGGALPPDWLAGYLDDLIARGALARARSVQIGYLGNPEQIELITRWLERALVVQPALRVQVDPVIGDFDHGIYVDPRMTPAWRRLLPHAHGLTPNHFELEQLSECTLSSLDECIGAARSLLTGATEWVVVTSAAPRIWSASEMHVLAVSRDQHKVFTHPRFACAVKGGGDLFSAHLTGWTLAGKTLFEAVDRASHDVVGILDRTRRLGWEELALAFPAVPHADR